MSLITNISHFLTPQWPTLQSLLQDICLLLTHIIILSACHIFIPEGNYGPYIRIYHPSMLSTIFSLKGGHRDAMRPSSRASSRNYMEQQRQASHWQNDSSSRHADVSPLSASSSPTQPSSYLQQRVGQLNHRYSDTKSGRWNLENWFSDELPNATSGRMSPGAFQTPGSAGEPSGLVSSMLHRKKSSTDMQDGQIPSTSSRTKFLASDTNSLLDIVGFIYWRTKRFILQSFYIIGAIICLPLIVFVLYALVRNLLDHQWRQQTIMLIPGFNVSLGLEAIMLFVSVLTVSLVHEWGHIRCATLFDYRVRQFGWMAYGPLWMGLSDIEWTSREDGSTKKIQKDNWKSKICVLLAGIWHNFCICALIYLIASTFWINEDGVRLVSTDSSGIIPESGMRIFQINDGDFIWTRHQFESQSLELSTRKEPLLYCMPDSQSTESTASCCETKGLIGNQFCFEWARDPNDEITPPSNADTCLSIKKMTIRNSPTTEQESCFHLKYPHENWQLISLLVGLKNDRSDAQRVLFYGDVEKFLFSLEVTDRHLQWDMDNSIPLAVSHTVYRFLQITFTLSFGLGMLNLLPIPLFDGSHVLSVILFEIAKWGASSKLTQRMVTAHLVFVLLCAALFLGNVGLSVWNAYVLFVR